MNSLERKTKLFVFLNRVRVFKYYVDFNSLLFACLCLPTCIQIRSYPVISAFSFFKNVRETRPEDDRLSVFPYSLHLQWCSYRPKSRNVLSFSASPDKMSDTKQILADNVRL